MQAFTHELREGRNLAAVLDRCGSWADAVHELPVQFPDLITDRCILAPDEQSSSEIKRVAAEIKFANAPGRNGVQPFDAANPELCAPTATLLTSIRRPQSLRRESSERKLVSLQL